MAFFLPLVFDRTSDMLFLLVHGGYRAGKGHPSRQLDGDTLRVGGICQSSRPGMPLSHCLWGGGQTASPRRSCANWLMEVRRILYAQILWRYPTQIILHPAPMNSRGHAHAHIPNRTSFVTLGTPPLMPTSRRRVALANVRFRLVATTAAAPIP